LHCALCRYIWRLSVFNCRLKQSGMFWTVRGANAILALRCSHLNGRFEDYWEERRDARAA